MRTLAFSAAAVAVVLFAAPVWSSAGIIHGPVIHPVTNHRYYLLDNANWFDSQQEAMALHGNLVTINDADENQWVVDNFSNVNGVVRELWIGLNDIANEGTFVWASGEPVNYLNWNTGEPNNNGDEDGVHIYPNPSNAPGRWNDANATRLSLDQALHGVVELPAASPPTITTGRATVTSPTSVTLTAVYSRNGGETFAGFEVGPTTAYGVSLGAVPIIGDTQGVGQITLGVPDLVPGKLYHYRAVAGNSAGTAFGEDLTFTAGNNPPFAFDDFFTLRPGFGPFVLDALHNDSDSERDPFTITSVSQGAHGSVVIIDNNTLLSYQLTDSSYVGQDTFTYTISDGMASVTAKVTVEIPIRDPITDVLFAKNSPVPDAGTDPRVPAGAKFTSFGLPSINDSGHLAFGARYRSNRGSRSVIVRSETNDVASVIVQSGDPVPDEEGALFPFTFASFKDPLFNNEGLIAFLARFSGPGISFRNDTGLFTESASHQLRLIAREGGAAPGTDGATFKTFVSMAMGSVVHKDSEESPRHVVAFVARLDLEAGKVTSANDTGLWIYRSAFFADTQLQLVLREGSVLDLDPTDGLPGKTVRSFVALQPLPGAAGQGNGVGQRDNARDTVPAKVIFDDATQAIVEFDASGQVLQVNATGETANSALVFKSFGTPTQSANGQRGYIASGSLAGKQSEGVFVANDPDSPNVFPQAFTGQPLPDRPELSFRRFINVATSSTATFAVTGQLSGPGISRSNDTEILWNGLGGLQPLFQEGSAAPGVEGGKFSNFLSLAVPESTRPLLKARVTRNISDNARGRDRNHTATTITDGLWYVDKANAVRLYLLQGDPLPEANNQIVRRIHILESVPASPTQTRSHNRAGQIAFRAVLNDGSQALIRTQLP